MEGTNVGQTTLGMVTEIGSFGSLNIKDPTVTEVSQAEELYRRTNDPHLKRYLEEQMKK